MTESSAVETRLAISFGPRFVTIEGSAPKSMAYEICFALAPIFKRHGLGLHLSVVATDPTDAEKIMAAAVAIKEAGTTGRTDLEVAVLAESLPEGVRVAKKHSFSGADLTHSEFASRMRGHERVRQVRRTTPRR